MLQQNSTTTTAPATTAAVNPAATGADIHSLIESARERARTAACLAQSFENLEEVSFSDLDTIARNCHTIARELQTIRQLLAERELA